MFPQLAPCHTLPWKSTHSEGGFSQISADFAFLKIIFLIIVTHFPPGIFLNS